MSDVSISIRYATLAAVPILAHFNCQIAVETEDRQLDRATVVAGIEALLGQDGAGFYLVAELHDKIVGCLMVTFEWSDWRNGVFWWIQSVYVDASARRQGVFRRLYSYTEDLARSQASVCGLRLYVERDNAIAQHTYGGLGMQRTPYQIFEKEFERREPPGVNMA